MHSDEFYRAQNRSNSFSAVFCGAHGFFAFGQKWCCNMGGAFFAYARIRAFFGFIMRKIKTKTYKTICIWNRNAAL
ncbi:MAG: hypothetical protein IJA06_00500 [Oscillospiraceae bacterium]|nr:hypothetical protein [Oscillospiraceae bacterium]